MSSQSFGGGSFTAGQVTNVFILSNGWKEASGTYTIGQLSYGVGSFPVNYGQNSPFVSTLYY